MHKIIGIILLFTQTVYAQVPLSELVPQRADVNGMVILPDGRKCRGVSEVSAQGKEYTRLVECEESRPQARQRSKHAENTSKKEKGFDVEDGEAHFAVKLGYSLDPKAAFRNVTVGNTQTKADILYSPMPTIEFEYGFYNKYAWNLIAGAGIDLEKRASATKYNFGSVDPQPIMRFSSMNLYLNAYRAFERFYIQLGAMYALPQVTFELARSSQGVGGFGYRVEVGYSLNKRWALYGGYRDFSISVDATMHGNNNTFLYNDGRYSDFLMGLRYFFR